MSYRIQYDTKKHPWQKRLKPQKYVLPVGIICLSLLTLGYFGMDKLQDPKKCKSCCLTMNDYPTANGGCEGHTKRTFILEAED